MKKYLHIFLPSVLLLLLVAFFVSAFIFDNRIICSWIFGITLVAGALFSIWFWFFSKKPKVQLMGMFYFDDEQPSPQLVKEITSKVLEIAESQ